MEPQIQVNSEIGRLKTVLLHRPGEELEALTPEYMSRMLFDDVPYLKVAQEEHDAFANVLRENGVEVLHLDQLAAEALANEEVRDRFIVEMVRASKQEETFSTFAIVNYLQSLEPLAMVRKVMAGVKKSEVEDMEPTNKQLHHFMVNDYPFYLDPMPNLYFTRDPAASIGNGLTINKMHWPARRRESLFMQYILKYHPRFANQNIPVWYNRNNRFSVEGGDELVLNKHTVAIGISERTEAEAIERIASRLFHDSEFTRVLAIKIPAKRAFMHLDTVFTMIDYDKFSVHPEIMTAGGELDIYVLDKSNTHVGYEVTHRRDLTNVLAESLGVSKVQLIQCGNGDPIAAAREQWNDGSNTLAIAPGVVITYDRNYVTNEALRKAGLKVIEVAGSELGRGRGGPRCMSMPLFREEI
ncbi:MAG: arginine deiminase [Candidatus Nanosyncoccus sp. P13S_S20_bin.18.1]|nr:arginine deiminase [Candidatus Nanosyncoccus sp. P13S_S20_bin.18.1]